MALSDEAVAKVSKLEGFHTYSVWGFKVENLLNRDDLWDMVTMGTKALIAVRDVDASAEKERQKKQGSK
jgi:hypothetical protein